MAGNRIVVLTVALLASAATAGPETPRTDAAAHPLAGVVVDLRSERTLSGPVSLAAALAEADVVVLGETHDNPEHHAAQAWLVSAMGAAALAFEMIPPELEPALAEARARRAEAAELAALLEWEVRGWPDFALYAPILEAAPDAPVSGGAVEPEALARAMEDTAAMAAPELAQYGLDDRPPAATIDAIAAELVEAHCDAIPLEAARGMVEAQRLRDAALADAAARALDAAGSGPIALIAGSGHARRDRGVPAALAAARPDLEVHAVALLEVGEAEDWRAYASEAGAPLYDYLWFFAPAEREDPCVAFIERMERR